MPITFDYRGNVRLDNPLYGMLPEAEALLKSDWGDDHRDIRPEFSDDTDTMRCYCVLRIDGVEILRHDFGLFPTAKDIADVLDRILKTGE